MDIEGDIFQELERWKARHDRKPLILQGARQIGKTWVMKEFGKRRYLYTAYFNFDQSEELCREFDKTKEPSRLMQILRLYTDVPILPEDTLIIFDEIQQSNRALNSLKYFCELAPEYHVIAAGSLLGVMLSEGDSFPVGKVEILQMFPISFREFLRKEQPNICQYLDGYNLSESLPEIVFNSATEAYRRYQVCGGMPAAAVAMLEGKGVEEVERQQRNILVAYTLDFSKHAPGGDIPRIMAVWNSIPSQLSRENRKFLYKTVKPGARAREYEDALLWLQQAGLIYRVFCNTRPGLPLSAYDDLSAFKIYLCDTGLLRIMSRLPAEIFLSDPPLYREFKGALAENAVLQALVPQFSPQPRYWVSSGTAEVDFVVQKGLDIVPIEAKAQKNTSGKSLSVYIGKYQPTKAVVFSANPPNPPKAATGITHLPLFMADWLGPILG